VSILAAQADEFTHDRQATQVLTGDFAAELAAMATQMLAHIGGLSKRIDTQTQVIEWRDAKIKNLTFQLARLENVFAIYAAPIFLGITFLQ
jgi:uncharacterized protein (DUF3084 family)